MITTRFQKKFREFASVLRNEYRNIFCDAGVLLIAVGAIFIYSTAYSLAYKNEVLRDVPVAVVDNSRTPSSPPTDPFVRRHTQRQRRLQTGQPRRSEKTLSRTEGKRHHRHSGRL